MLTVLGPSGRACDGISRRAILRAGGLSLFGGLLATDLRGAVGRRVRDLRRGAGISQQELAARAGLHRNYIESVEPRRRDALVRALGRP